MDFVLESCLERNLTASLGGRSAGLFSGISLRHSCSGARGQESLLHNNSRYLLQAPPLGLFTGFYLTDSPINCEFVCCPHLLQIAHKPSSLPPRRIPRQITLHNGIAQISDIY